MSLLIRQAIYQETAARQNVQILEHVVIFKRALEEINLRILDYVDKITEKSQDPAISSAIDTIVKHAQLQQSITSSMEKALDVVLNQDMTAACNLLLARRDSFLKDAMPGISSQDNRALRTASFSSRELFPTYLINDVENNLIKRIGVNRSEPNPKRQRRGQNYSSRDFGPRSRSGFSGHQQPQQPFRQDAGTRPARGRGTRAYRANRSGRGVYRK